MLCKPFFYRAIAYMNALCIFANIPAFILFDIIFKNIFSLRQTYVWILLATKIILASLISL